jgi:hypothetical protein
MKLSHVFGFLLCAWGCDQGPPPTTSTGQSTQSMEWVGFHAEVPWAAGDFHALVSGLIGPDAQKGNFVTNKQVTQGIFLSASAETATTAQSRIALTFDDGSGTPRVLAIAPASFAVGNVFLTTIDAALAKMQADNAQHPGSGESFLLQYKVVSAQGGTLTLGVHADAGAYSLVVDVASPPTNLTQGKIGTPVSNADPYDTVDGTVWFHLSKDDFDFFATHAYGSDGTAAQNFHDFALEPHNWLRLNVDPHLADKYVSVGFEVVGTDGTRTPIAKAPASILAGSLFQAMVDRNMKTMLAQEAAKAGSSTPWQVPFFYNAPVGGGVVQVIAQGNAGTFVIAYAVEAPQHTLVDVPFNAYEDVVVTPPDPSTACDQLGNAGIVASSQGAFSITFTASDVVRNSTQLTQPLVGDIDCSVFAAADVDIAGPKPGAQEINEFVVPHADMTNPAAPPTYLTGIYPKGDYQILCNQDLNGNGNVDVGEPITLPVGSFTVACNVNPVTVQFALLDPQ